MAGICARCGGTNKSIMSSICSNCKFQDETLKHQKEILKLQKQQANTRNDESPNNGPIFSNPSEVIQMSNGIVSILFNRYLVSA